MLSANFKPKKNSCGIARFPCDSTVFLLVYKLPLQPLARLTLGVGFGLSQKAEIFGLGQLASSLKSKSLALVLALQPEELALALL